MVYLWLLIIVACGLVVWGLTQPSRVYQFPFLAGITALGWLIPQAVSLTEFVFIPDEAIARMLLMGTLCMAMIYVGYVWPKRPLQILDWTFDEKRLLRASLILTVVGGIFYVLIYQLNLSNNRTWSGLPVAYLFFASLADYGFAIAVLMYARFRSKLALWVALGGSIFYLEKIFFGVRRGGIAEFVLIIVLAAWFGRKTVIPRGVMITGLLSGLLLINVNISELRNAASDGLTLSELQRIEWVQSLDELASPTDEFESGNEIEAGAYRMEVAASSGTYDFGAFHWNRLVFNYVPAQLFGQSFKQSFYIGTYSPSEVSGAYERFWYTKQRGLTSTGMADAFNSFWYFGCLKFFVVAFIMGKLFMAANNGHFVAQLLCMILTVPAMHIVTHNTHWFFQGWPHMLVFLGGALWYAKKRTATRAKSMTSID